MVPHRLRQTTSGPIHGAEYQEEGGSFFWWHKDPLPFRHTPVLELLPDQDFGARHARAGCGRGTQRD